MDDLRGAVIASALIAAVAMLAGCQKGPVQETAGKAGKKVVTTVEDIKR
jgi:hypothetical protein